MGRIKRAGIVGAAALVAAMPALAEPPSNDDRANARAVTVPSTVEGTTREATTQNNEPSSNCSFAEATVWYALDPSTSRRISIEIRARGDLEAVIDVFRRDRSQLEQVDCDETDRRGRGTASFQAEAGERYLIRVGQAFESEPGAFSLELFAPEPEARPPGTQLPRSGGVATVDPARDLSDAWSMRLRKGQPYVFTLAARGDACPRVEVHGPNASSFDDLAVDGGRCDRHNLFTPERTGRYSFLVRAARRPAGLQRYRIRARPASRDDTAPGNVLRNYERARGHVGPDRGDVVDLHRFYVNRRSDVTLRFGTTSALQLELRNVRGRLLQTAFGDGIRAVLRRGRYYATVRSTSSGGKYTLRPVVRGITVAGIAINGRGEAVISPGQAATVGVGVRPAAGGRVTILVERLDPLEGWQFHRRFVRRTGSGRAAASFVPRRPGRFRATATYSGSRLWAPSETGYAYVSARERF